MPSTTQTLARVPTISLRRTLAAGGIVALAWSTMGAAPLSAPPGLTNSAPQFTVNRFDKSDRLSMTRTPAVQHDRRRLSRLLNGNFPSNWHWS